MSDTSSDASSDTGSESGRSGDNASYAARPSFTAGLQTRSLQSVMHDWQVNNEAGFQQRCAAQGYSFPNSADSQPRYVRALESDTMSLAMSARSHSTATGSSRLSAPSFGSYSTAPSSSSAQTGRADSIIQANVLEDLDSSFQELAVQRTPTFQCCYSFLGCSYASPDLKEWDTHCQYHLRGNLPKSTRCPFQCEWDVTARTGQEAWSRRWAHIIHDHSTTQRFMPCRKPDPGLLRHLWNCRIISDAELKELREQGCLAERPAAQGELPAAYLRSARTDNRRRRRA